MNTQFGSFWHRLIRGGNRLAPIEEALLKAFVQRMPSQFQVVLETQLEATNLAQRVADWKGVNFYRLRRGKTYLDDLEKLPCKDGTVKLLSLQIAVDSLPEPIHVAYWSVRQFFFAFGTDISLKPVRSVVDLSVQEVTSSWRSNAVWPAA